MIKFNAGIRVDNVNKHGRLNLKLNDFNVLTIINKKNTLGYIK